MKKTFVNGFLVAISIIALTLTTSCKKPQKEKPKRMVSVLVEHPHKGDLRKYLSVNGQLAARYEVKIYSDVPGKISKILAYEGDSVSKDQSIALIDRSQVGANFSLAPAKSPISGYVTSIYVTIGHTVAPQVPIATVGNIDTIDILINIPERLVHEVKTGQLADIILPSRQDKPIKATIYRKDLSVDPMSHTLLVRATMKNPNKDLLPGMYADVNILTDEAKDVFILPNSAVFSLGDTNFVYVIIEKRDGDKGKQTESENYNKKTNEKKETEEISYIAITKPVDVLFSYQEKIAIRSGISSEDEIVVFGREFLEEGSLVNPIRETEQK